MTLLCPTAGICILLTDLIGRSTLTGSPATHRSSRSFCCESQHSGAVGNLTIKGISVWINNVGNPLVEYVFYLFLNLSYISIILVMINQSNLFESDYNGLQDLKELLFAALIYNIFWARTFLIKSTSLVMIN